MAWPLDWSAEDREVVWHGTSDELRDLCLAAYRVCACCFNEMDGSIRVPCAAHSMLDEQGLLDHLLYVRRTRGRYLRAEWQASGSAPPTADALRSCTLRDR